MIQKLIGALIAALIALSAPAQAGGDVGYPPDAFALSAASGTVANAAAASTLTATAGRRVFLCGFTITSTGSTAASVVAPTITGLTGGTHTFAYASVAGATLSNQPIQFVYSPCIPASADGTNIVVNLPALGAGNTNATTTAWGYIR